MAPYLLVKACLVVLLQGQLTASDDLQMQWVL